MFFFPSSQSEQLLNNLKLYSAAGDEVNQPAEALSRDQICSIFDAQKEEEHPVLIICTKWAISKSTPLD